jgi:hypothetical protein
MPYSVTAAPKLVFSTKCILSPADSEYNKMKHQDANSLAKNWIEKEVKVPVRLIVVAAAMLLVLLLSLSRFPDHHRPRHQVS